MGATFFDKYPDEVIEFDYDASDILLNGDTISAAEIVILSGGISASAATISGNIIHFTISGGTEGVVARAFVKATLESGQVREALVSILIKRLPTS